MIKLVVSDLDGTLLKANKQLPATIFEVIENLRRKGILFGAASGRQLQNLKDLFAPAANDMVFIAENGGLGWYRNELLFCNALSPRNAQNALQRIRDVEGLFPLLCTPDCAYYENLSQPFEHYVHASYTFTKQADLDEVAADKPVCKIAVYDQSGAEKHGMNLLPQVLPDLRVIQSGMEWLDVSAPSATKGAALDKNKKKTGISSAECMAFGDHMNDYEMLAACAHPRVPANAYYKLKECFPDHIIPSNEEEGVIRILNDLLRAPVVPI